MNTPASHFDLTNESAYLQWRAEKLAYYQSSSAIAPGNCSRELLSATAPCAALPPPSVKSPALPYNAMDGAYAENAGAIFCPPASLPSIQSAVYISDPLCPQPEELIQLVRRCERTNWVIYYCPQIGDDPEKIRALGVALGLKHMDQNLCADQSSISAIRVREDSARHTGYIPYTNKPLTWHTDGYYNVAARKINAILMHCVTAAAEGGHNSLLDPEMVYLLLRDLNPEWINALMAPDALTIPENRDGDVLRLKQTGPVFSIDPLNGKLHMRYTARKRSVEWKQDSYLQAAVKALGDILAAETPYHYHYRPSAGYGIISNNCLHNRSAFHDDPKLGKIRLVYRARYYERVGALGPAVEERHDVMAK